MADLSETFKGVFLPQVVMQVPGFSEAFTDGVPTLGDPVPDLSETFTGVAPSQGG